MNIISKHVSLIVAWKSSSKGKHYLRISWIKNIKKKQSRCELTWGQQKPSQIIYIFFNFYFEKCIYIVIT